MKQTHVLLHEKAVVVVKQYLRHEAEVISVLQEIDECRSYLEFGCVSLYVYATQKLGLSDDTALNFINVARKARKIPALQKVIQDGTLTVSKAKKITSVLTPENQDHWIELARTLPKASLEREVARVNPKVLTPEKAKYVTADRLKLELGVSEELMKKLRRVQDLLAQSRRTHVSLEEALDAMADQFIERKDPVVKAQRVHEKYKSKAEEKTLKTKENKDPQQNDLRTEAKTSNVQIRVLNHQNGPNSHSKPEFHSTPEKQQVPGPGSKELGRLTTISKSTSRSTKIKISSKRPASTPTSTLSTQRKPYSAVLKHELNLRDSGQCTELDEKGSRCTQRRWVDFHHIIPRSQGGKDTPENMTTLCRAHHQIKHQGGNTSFNEIL